MPAPETIHQLVAKFEENRAAYRSGKYNEARLRQEFLDPFFAALGWDVYNQKCVAPQYAEVEIETSLSIEGTSKSPDYTFKVGPERKFFVEAKKPAVDIKYDIHPAYQLRRYAWNAHLPLSILTDFEELAVYNCRVRPNPNDNPADYRDMYFTYDEYIERWDEIAAVFSRDAVWRGALDRYAESSKGKKGTTEVDDEFLKDMNEWRVALARNIALRNQAVADEQQLNYAVQMTIDRIIFLRICEDRGIEPEDQLKTLAAAPGVYARLVELFRRADVKYNSGLFHFNHEKASTTQPDAFTPGLCIDDRVLKDIIKDIYYPCPYIFKEIPVEILGQVYEQFLGQVIRLTAGHQAKVEEKPEVRKAGGVYYTPRYIVDYIVENTVGKLLEGRTPEQAAALKIVDPACGSGSFLLGAFQYLIDWHEQWYLANDAQKWAKGKNPALVEITNGWKLTTLKKKEILINNLHGVDIDPQAVEVTKLSLLLKVLEEESGQLSLGLERALPDLGRNIQCGNSLIGWDYFAGQLVVDDAERRRVNPFEWKDAFPQVFASGASGGFDAVIGNPPYRKERDSKDLLADLMKSDYGRKYYQGKMDFWYFFLHRAIEITKHFGLIGFIVPSYWLYSSGASLLIKRISETAKFDLIVDFGQNKIFQDVSGKHMVFVLEKNTQEKILNFVDFISNGMLGQEISNELIQHTDKVRVYTVSNKEIFSQKNKINLRVGRFSDILEKVSMNSFELQNELKTFEVSQGLVEAPDIVSQSISIRVNDYSCIGEEVFVITQGTYERLSFTNLEKQFLRKYLRGVDVSRYMFNYSNYYVFYIGNKENQDIKRNRKLYPNIVKHLDKYKKFITSSNAPYGIHRIRDPRFFEAPKIIGQNMFDNPSFTYCAEGFYVNFAFNIIISNSNLYDLKYLLGILNSKFGAFWFNLNAKKRGVNNDLGVGVLRTFPVANIDFTNPNDSQKHNLLVSSVNRMLDLHKQTPATPQEHEQLQRQIAATDRQIDTLVYQLYGLTDEEIALVESS